MCAAYSKINLKCKSSLKTAAVAVAVNEKRPARKNETRHLANTTHIVPEFLQSQSINLEAKEITPKS